MPKLIISLFRILPVSVIKNIDNSLLKLHIKAQEAIRIKQSFYNSCDENLPLVFSYDHEDRLERSILDGRAKWHKILLEDKVEIPGMLTLSEKQYYLYLGRFYSGFGKIVELGPCLGLSTYYLVSGLLDNPNFKNQKIHVYDDFIWRSSWMDKWLVNTKICPPDNHGSFKDLFIDQMKLSGIDDKLQVYQNKFSDYDGNESLDCVDWDIESPIEMIIIDCGRTISVNEGWWNIFSPSFVKNKTLIVMQDWQQHKQVPELFYNQIKLFTDSKFNQIELIHEVLDAGIATFLYRG